MTKKAATSITHNPVVSILIGVTGHRDLFDKDIPHLQAAVREILKSIQRKCPLTPIVLISPLAEGADRLVARVAMDEFKAQLVVPLPLPKDQYERDFSSPASLEEFRALVSSAADTFELPVVEGNTAAGIRVYGPQRDKQYAQAGAYVVRHCHLLIALWDGELQDTVGGTSAVINYVRNGVPAPYARQFGTLDTMERCAVYHILTPRKINPKTAGAPYSGKFLGFEEGAKAGSCFRRIITRIESFNSKVKSLQGELSGEIRQNKHYLFPHEGDKPLPAHLEEVRNLYAAADTLAIYYQKKSRHTLLILLALALGAVLVFEIYSHSLISSSVFSFYPLFLIAAYLVYRHANNKEFQNRHLDYRALAEGLRVVFFWRLAGLRDNAAEYYLRQQRSELEWVRYAIHTFSLSPEKHKQAAPDPALVLKYWVEDQAKYFKKSALRENKKSQAIEERTTIGFWAGILLAAAVMVYSSVMVHGAHGKDYLHIIVIILMGYAPACAAAQAGYAEKMAFTAQARRYAWTCRIFTNAAEQLRGFVGSNKLPEAQEIIRELGKEALEENGNWVILHRERPIEVPK